MSASILDVSIADALQLVAMRGVDPIIEALPGDDPLDTGCGLAVADAIVDAETAACISQARTVAEAAPLMRRALLRLRQAVAMRSLDVMEGATHG